MSVLAGLGRLSRSLAASRATGFLVATLAGVSAGAAAAAVLAWAGLLAELRWLPLALWVLSVGALLLALALALRRMSRRGPELLRQTAALVETELELRRGALVGVVDLAGAEPAGTSAALAARASERLMAVLPQDPLRSWAPAARHRERVRMLRRAGALAVALAAAALAFWTAGDAAAALVSPLRAARAAFGSRVRVSVSARAVRPGQSVAVMVQAEPGVRHVALHLRARGEPWHPILLRADEAGRAAYRVVNLLSTTFAYATAAGATSDTVEVLVLQPLVIGELSVSASYPAYLGRDDEPLDPSAPLVVPEGTGLGIRGVASGTLARAALVSGADTESLGAAGTAFAGRLTVRRSAAWRLGLVATSGSTPAEEYVFDVRAVPDSAPVVAVPVPGADTAAPLDLRPAVVVDARDDHALGRVEIISWRVSRLGVVGDTVRDTLAGVSGADRMVASTVLDLTRRGLLPGDTLRYFARAADLAPVPHVGRSPVYAFRLRSMAELREAARRQGDSLSREAAAIAGEQSSLQRETEDLAAQRNRTGDRSARPGEPPAGGERAEETRGTVPLEEATRAQQLLERQQSLLVRAESLRTELQELARAAEQAGLTDPSWQQRMRELEALLDQAMTPELRRSLEELRRALERLDPNAVREALRRMASQQQRLREELERSAELFERAAIEGSLQTLAEQAAELAREQREWTDRAPARRDSAGAAAEERRLMQQADTLSSGLDALASRLERRSDSAASAGRTGARQAARAAVAMNRAALAMQGGDRGAAAAAGEEAARALESLPGDLEDARNRMAARWRTEVLRMLARSTQETISLAMGEQALAQAVRRGEAGTQEARGRQAAAEQGIGQVMRQLQEASGRNALVSPRLGASLARARDVVAESRQSLEGSAPSPEEAAARAGEAAQLLSAAALQMMRTSEVVGGAESGSGFAEAMRRMAQLAAQQSQLNDQLGGLLPMIGSGDEAIMLQLRMLAERQRRLAAEMERLAESGMPGHPEQLAEEARQLADRIERGRLDRATLERQQRLFRRMLEAGRTLRNEDEPEDPERKSRTAEARPGLPPPATSARGPELRYPVPPWTSLRSLSPSERAMVLDYFRRLNARP